MRVAAALVLIAIALLPDSRPGNAEMPELLSRPIVRLDVVHELASYHGHGFDGLPAASGMRFDMDAFVAAHPTYPFGSLIRVTNVKNGRSVRVHIIDRGPAHGPRSEGVIIDLSQRAAKALDFIEHGRTRVQLEVLRWGAGLEMR